MGVKSTVPPYSKGRVALGRNEQLKSQESRTHPQMWRDHHVDLSLTFLVGLQTGRAHPLKRAGEFEVLGGSIHSVVVEVLRGDRIFAAVTNSPSTESREFSWGRGRRWVGVCMTEDELSFETFAETYPYLAVGRRPNSGTRHGEWIGYHLHGLRKV